jgi:GT2 family glycosyltransferase
MSSLRARLSRLLNPPPTIRFAEPTPEDLAAIGRGPVTAVVPNFNHARFLPGRLDSIARQGRHLARIVFLDDASTDGSVAVAEAWSRRRGVALEIHRNATNTGSPIAQWREAARLATTDLLWIAESDDLAEPDLLATLLPCLDDAEVVLAYAQSGQIDGRGRLMATDYLPYVADLDPVRWTQAHVADGREEVERYLSVRNTIPNASAVLFRRGPLLRAIEAAWPRASRERFEGDWVVYRELLPEGKVAFRPERRNWHRRHGG